MPNGHRWCLQSKALREGYGAPMSSESFAAPADPAVPTEAVTELLGAIAYAELTAGLRMAADALTAPDLGVRIWMGRSAAAEFEHFERIAARLRDLGREPQELMTPFTSAVDEFHERTRPREWLEALVKAYVGDGIARDFFREIGQHVDEPSRALIEAVLEVDAQDEFVVRTVTGAIQEDPTVAGRLALWARRLVGEAIAQTQYVALERDALMGLLVGAPGTGGGADLADLGRMFTRLIEQHGERMGRLGLTP